MGCTSNHCHRTKLNQQFKPTFFFIDFDVASLGDDVMNAHGLTLFKFVRNVSKDVQSSLHGIEIVRLLPMASRWRVTFLSPFRVKHVSVLAS